MNEIQNQSARTYECERRDEELISAPALRDLFYPSKSAVTLWRWERDGILPPATRINGRKYWRWSDVSELLEGSVAA